MLFSLARKNSSPKSKPHSSSNHSKTCKISEPQYLDRELQKLSETIIWNKYFDKFNFYFAKPINEIFSNASTPQVILLKDFNYFDEQQEYLKRYYYSSEWPEKLATISNHYQQNTEIPKPNLVIHQQNQLILKRNRKVQKLQSSKRAAPELAQGRLSIKKEKKLTTSDEEFQLTEKQVENPSVRKLSEASQINFVELIENEEKKKANLSFESDLYDIYDTPVSLQKYQSKEDLIGIGTQFGVNSREESISKKGLVRRQFYKLEEKIKTSKNSRKEKSSNKEIKSFGSKMDRCELLSQEPVNLEGPRQVTPKKPKNKYIRLENHFQQNLSGEKRPFIPEKLEAGAVDLTHMKEMDPSLLFNKYMEFFKEQDLQDSKKTNVTQTGEQERSQNNKETLYDLNTSVSPKPRQPTEKRQKQSLRTDTVCSPVHTRVLKQKKSNYKPFSRLVLPLKHTKNNHVSSKSQLCCNFNYQMNNTKAEHQNYDSIYGCYEDQGPSSLSQQAKYSQASANTGNSLRNDQPVPLHKRQGIPKNIVQLNISKAFERDDRSISKLNRTERSPVTERPQLTERQLVLLQIYAEVPSTKRKNIMKANTSRPRMRTQRQDESAANSSEKPSRENDPLSFLRSCWRKQILNKTIRESSSCSNRDAKKFTRTSPKARYIKSTRNVLPESYVLSNSKSTKAIRSFKEIGSNLEDISLQNNTFDPASDNFTHIIQRKQQECWSRQPLERKNEKEILEGESEIRKFKAEQFSDIDSIIENDSPKISEMQSKKHLKLNLNKLNPMINLNSLSSCRNQKDNNFRTDRTVTFVLEHPNSIRKLKLSPSKQGNNFHNLKLNESRNNRSTYRPGNQKSRIQPTKKYFFAETTDKADLNESSLRDICTSAAKGKSIKDPKESLNSKKLVKFQILRQVNPILRNQPAKSSKSPKK